MGEITHYNGCWHERNHHECAVREIERLSDAMVIARTTEANLHEEIDRLRAYESGTRCPHCDELRLELGAARAEIERLSAENALLTKGWQPPTPTALLAEIERLRKELSEYTQAVQKRDVEIDRLRGLLRFEADEWMRIRLAFVMGSDRYQRCIGRSTAIEKELGDE